MVFSGSLAPCLGSYSFRKSSQQSVRGLRPLPAYSALPEPTEKRPEPDAVALVPALVLTDASESVLSESVQETPLEAFWRSYLTLLEEKPILVKSMTSFFGFMIGDLCAQFIMGGDYDLLRTIRLTLFGVLMDGPIGHCWYLLLDQNVFPESPTEPKAVVTKTLLDQLAWAPFFSCVFFTFNQTLQVTQLLLPFVELCFQGHPGTSLAVIRKTLVPTLTANWTLWPLAHIINFKFVPSNQRILYINFVQVRSFSSKRRFIAPFRFFGLLICRIWRINMDKGAVYIST